MNLEERFQRDCERALDKMGLLWHHCPDARRCRGPRGFPDLWVAGANGLLGAELKSPDGDTSAAQDLWLWTLGQAARTSMATGSTPLHSMVVRPRDRDDFFEMAEFIK